jgi:hypothetical protein
MFDLFVSFGLGILLGVCLTLLTLSIKNKRKTLPATKISQISASAEQMPSTVQGEPVEHADHGAKTPDNFDREIDELEGFIRLDGATTDMPESATKTPDAEIVKDLPSDEHLENEWIEAERVEATRVELELQETARLEAMHHATDHFAEDHPATEELINLNLQEEFAALQALQALQIEVARVEAERIEEDRIEAERIEAERIETERVEAARLDAERVEQDRVEAERVEIERVEAERIEAERSEAERI